MTSNPEGWPDAYACVDVGGLTRGSLSLRPIAWADREPIRRWRNDQLDVLRQSAPLTEDQQDRYFATVVRPQLEQERPDQILVALIDDASLVGYGGLVHISWPNRRAEISFMTETTRSADNHRFQSDLRAFLSMVTELASRLVLHRLTTECYAFRDDFIEQLEAAGFVREGRLREHVRTEEGFIDSVLHGRLLDRRW